MPSGERQHPAKTLGILDSMPRHQRKLFLLLAIKVAESNVVPVRFLAGSKADLTIPFVKNALLSESAGESAGLLADGIQCRRVDDMRFSCTGPHPLHTLVDEALAYFDSVLKRSEEALRPVGNFFCGGATEGSREYTRDTANLVISVTGRDWLATSVPRGHKDRDSPIVGLLFVRVIRRHVDGFQM